MRWTGVGCVGDALAAAVHRLTEREQCDSSERREEQQADEGHVHRLLARIAVQLVAIQVQPQLLLAGVVGQLCQSLAKGLGEGATFDDAVMPAP